MINSKNFYSEMKAFHRFSELTEASNYKRAPDDWWILITDVKGSTRAIENNRYKDVNLLGASSIIAILNILKGQQVPFVFGGDGATLLVHESDVERVKPALLGTQRLAKDVFGFELRIGLVPVAMLTQSGAVVEVGKFAISEKSTIATLRGGGLSLAEKMVKDPRPENSKYRLDFDGSIAADVTSFEGLSCRWNPIKAKPGCEFISLLVVAIDLSTSETVYRRIIKKIEGILDEKGSCPISPEKLDRGLNIASLIKEMRIHTIGRSFLAKAGRLFKIFFEVGVMRIFMATGAKTKDFSAEKYIQEMSDNTDFQKFDDMIRMVRDCTTQQREQILSLLRAERDAGHIAYGLHTSNEALLTCLVFQLDNHIHFVDGSNGGYALAAKQLKEQLKMPLTAEY